MAFTQQLRPYQRAAVDKALAHLQAQTQELTNPRLSVASPTATGKGSIGLAILHEAREKLGLRGLILAPTSDIVRGFMERQGKDFLRLDTERTAKHGVATPLAYLNRLCDGRLPPADFLVIDENHEWIPSNKLCGDFDAALGYVPWIGLTATPFRGTFRGTIEYREYWGEPYHALTYPQAVEQGFISWPDFEQRLLIDDDEIKVSSQGEFLARESDEFTAQFDRSRAIAEIIAEKHSEGRSIVVSLPGSASVFQVYRDLRALGLQSSPVTQDVSPGARAKAYQLSANPNTRYPLLQVATIYRGADLPWLDTLVDAQPTLSPVRFMQTYGRIMRTNKPAHSKAPLAVVTNRNLERNAHLLVGVMPVKELAKFTQDLPQPSRRGSAAWLGFEDLARRKLQVLPTRFGYQVQFGVWRKTDPRTGTISEAAAILMPLHGACLTFTRELTVDKESRSAYPWKSSPWKMQPLPPLKGWTAAPNQDTTPKQKEYWGRMAHNVGLDADSPPSKRLAIGVLQLAWDTGLRFRPV